MTRIIAVASGKGGVGKTTLVSNLSSSLAGFSRRVIAVDGNTTTSNLGLQLGMSMPRMSIQDVMKGRASVRDALAQHQDGFRFIPADMSLDSSVAPDGHRLVGALYKLLGEADYVLIDTAAGLGSEATAALRAADELLVVVNPDMASLTDALKLVKVAERHETVPVGVVVNRVRGEPEEIPAREIESFLGVPVIGRVSEDRAVRRAAAERSPVVSHSPRALASQQLRAIAAGLAGESYQVRVPLMSRLFGFLRPG